MSTAPTGRARERFALGNRSGGRGGTETRAHILFVGDDEETRGILEALLRSAGFAVSTASNGEAALADALRALPDVALADLPMRPIDGAELCRRIHQIDPDLPVILMTGSSDAQAVIESFRAGAEDCLIKPFRHDAVLGSLDRAISRRTSKVEQEKIHRTLNERLVLSAVRDQEHAEAEAKQRAQFAALLENLSEGAIIADPGGGILMINRAARAILGVGHEDLSTVAALAALEAHELDGRPLRNEQLPLMRALRGELFSDSELLYTRPNSEARHIVSTGTSVRDEGGKIALAIVVFRDVTELKRLEQQRDEYLALISHDLRGPLSGIMMFVSAMKRTMEQTGVPVTLAERAERNAMRMKAMLEDLTEAAILESHGVALQYSLCDVRDLVVGAVADMGGEAARRVTIETDDAPSYAVLGDPIRLERAIANLLTNALKYSPEGAPVNARVAHTGSEVELDVIDRGIGIARENQKMIFDRYSRTRAGQERASGIGLGLYITRLIVEAHRGRIGVSSEVGKGSTFRLTLPSHTPA